MFSNFYLVLSINEKLEIVLLYSVRERIKNTYVSKEAKIIWKIFLVNIDRWYTISYHIFIIKCLWVTIAFAFSLLLLVTDSWQSNVTGNSIAT